MRKFSPGSDPIPTRYSLLGRLENWDDHESWQTFFDTYRGLIYSTAIKSGLTESEAEDVVQETVLSVARDIQKFKRDRSLGSFKGWLKNLTRWRIADQLRKRVLAAGRKTEAGETPEAVSHALEQVPDQGEGLDAIWETEWNTHLFSVALERVKRQIKAEQFQIFHLYALENWPAGRVSRRLGVSLAQVYLAKHRVRGLLKKEMRKLKE